MNDQRAGSSMPSAAQDRQPMRLRPSVSVLESHDRRFPVAAGIFIGLGLGGFFDGIVLHQILQWHHMFTSAGHLATTVEDLKFNTLWDGIFHAGTYVFVAIGLLLLWRTAHRSHLWRLGKLLAGTFLIGFGTFNVVEGIIDHHVLGIHHLNEAVPEVHWIYWDIGFLLWSLAMLIGGWDLFRAGKKESPGSFLEFWFIKGNRLPPMEAQ